MSPRPTRLSCHGFDLRLENGFGADEARAVIERVLATGGDRVSFSMERPDAAADPRDAQGRPVRVFVKAEFRRPDQPLSRRLKPGRAVSEGRGYRAFAAAGIPTPRLFAFGEQSRLRPRGGAVVVTERIRARDAAKQWARTPDVEVGRRVARAIARVHGADLVHGDAVMRNVLLAPGVEYVVDLPGWSAWSAAGAERDLALLVGSAMNLGADDAAAASLLDEYAASGAAAGRLASGWRARVDREARAYVAHLADRDATRAERRARKQASIVRPGARAPAAKEKPA